MPELIKLFHNARVVGRDVEYSAYARQDEHVERGDPAFVMSRSELALFASNPARWLAGYQPKDTEATEWGELQDTRVTLPHLFDRRYATTPATCLATKSMAVVKEGKAQVGNSVLWNPHSAEAKKWKEQQEAAGLIALPRDQRIESDQALDRLYADSIIDRYLKSCSFQVMVVGQYRDRQTERIIPVKCLIDLVPAKDSAFAYSLGDFKTARSADPEVWRDVVDKRGYDMQAAMALDLYEEATHEGRTTFLHIIQENVFPWQPARRLITDSFQRIGRLKLLAALEQYCRCLNDNSWPSWDDQGENFNGWGKCEPKEWTAVRYLGHQL